MKRQGSTENTLIPAPWCADGPVKVAGCDSQNQYAANEKHALHRGKCGPPLPVNSEKAAVLPRYFREATIALQVLFRARNELHPLLGGKRHVSRFL